MRFGLQALLCVCPLVSGFVPPEYNRYQSNSEQSVARRGATRGITYFMDVSGIPYVDPKSGESFLRGHGVIHIEGTSTDGPLRFEVAGDGTSMWPRLLDLTTESTGKTVSITGRRIIIGPFDLTRLENKDFCDPETGDGIVRRITERDPTVRYGPGNAKTIRTCHNWILDLLDEMAKVEDTYYNIPDKMGQVITASNKAAGELSTKDQTIKVSKFTLSTAQSGGGKTEKSFNINAKPDPPASAPPANEYSDEITVIRPEEYGGSIADFALDPQGDLVEKPKKELDLSDKQSTAVRVMGKLQRITTLGKAAFTTLGVAGILVGAAFVILDFVNHNWEGAVVGAIATAAGVAVGFAMEGPAGWIIGGLIALFASKPPERANIFARISWPHLILDLFLTCLCAFIRAKTDL